MKYVLNTLQVVGNNNNKNSSQGNNQTTPSTWYFGANIPTGLQIKTSLGQGSAHHRNRKHERADATEHNTTSSPPPPPRPSSPPAASRLLAGLQHHCCCCCRCCSTSGAPKAAPVLQRRPLSRLPPSVASPVRPEAGIRRRRRFSDRSWTLPALRTKGGMQAGRKEV